QHFARGGLMRQRFAQLPRSAIELFLQVGGRWVAVARGRQRAARLRLRGLATPCFHQFTACGAMPSHLALHFGGRAYTITTLTCVVRHSKMRWPTSVLVRHWNVFTRCLLYRPKPA